jgi:hypothetical protein
VKKYSAFAVGQIIATDQPILSHSEGRLAIVTDAGQGAVAVDVPSTNGTEADGEVVWS